MKITSSIQNQTEKKNLLKIKTSTILTNTILIKLKIRQIYL